MIINSLFLLLANPIFAEDTQEVSELVKFLVSDQLLIQSQSSQLVPLSYYTGTQSDIDKYFGDYVCAPTDTCRVVDSLYSEPFAILGYGLPPFKGTTLQLLQAQAQIERSDMRYGADIYDGATWQIALGLASKHNLLDKGKASQLVANQLAAIQDERNRGTSTTFQYGYTQPVTDPSKAYTFRMITTHFFNKDPFFSNDPSAPGKYQTDVSWDYDPNELAKNDPNGHNADFFKYTSTWSDWKPITGENAWAQLIGPLQAEYLLHGEPIDPNHPALVNAMNSLYAFSAMQAGVGGFYYAPNGSDGNQGPIPRGEISIENNFSMLGGLEITKQLLEKTAQTEKVKVALAQIDVMLNGGKTVNHYKTLGLFSFLYNGAFNAKKGVFYTHGTAVTPSSTKDWQPDDSDAPAANAVDVNTWGIAALGPKTIDAWFGDGAAMTIWQQVRAHGGYFNGNEFWGVGYTFNNHGSDQSEQVMSAEWTAGAINAVESLINYYQDKNQNIDALHADLTAMQHAIVNLRNDKYLDAKFINATPEAHFVKVSPKQGLAYLYASQRYAIPFGWNANTLPSTTSNAWVVMNHFHFNPFQYQGRSVGEGYPTPETVVISGDTGVLPADVTVLFNAGDLGPISQLSLSFAYTQTGDWITAETQPSTVIREGRAKILKGAAKLSIAFNNKGWFGACQVTPATKICKDDACHSLYTIETKWSANGRGECGLK